MKLRERLDRLESKLGAGNRAICVVVFADETIEDAELRLSRWQEDETEPHVWANPSLAEEHVVFIQSFTENSDGTAVQM